MGYTPPQKSYPNSRTTGSEPGDLDDGWRPGFAKRAENFGQVCDAAESWRWSAGVTVARLATAVLKGTPDLTLPQRMTLLLYVEHLNQERLERSEACVWPSTALIADYLGCNESTVRAHRSALEGRGYIVRDYTPANRPAGVQAYDLAPLAGRLDELEAIDDALRAAHRARRSALQEPTVFRRRTSARALKNQHLEQSPELNQSGSVTRSAPAAPAGQFEEASRPAPGSRGTGGALPTKPIGEAGVSAVGSPKGARDRRGALPDPAEHSRMVRQELQAALQVCPRLRQYVPAGFEDRPLSGDLRTATAVAAAADQLLPEPERNNGLSLMWGWKRHGPRVIAMLAIALEDPSVKDRCAYFGWMVTRDAAGAPDLRLNFFRLLKAKGEALPEDEPMRNLLAAPGIDDPTWKAIDEKLRVRVRSGPYGSWFSRLGFHGLDGGVLSLSTPTGTAAERLQSEWRHEIVSAAQAAGFDVRQVTISVRRDSAS